MIAVVPISRLAHLLLRLLLVGIQIVLVLHFAGSWPLGAVIYALVGLVFARDAVVAIENISKIREDV